MIKPQSGHMVMENRDGKFVFKPFELFGEGFKTVPHNEIMVDDIAHHLGFEDLVPTTYLIEEAITIGDDEVTLRGSAQEFIGGKVIPLHLYKGKLNKVDATNMVLLDVLTGNVDRKAENILVDKNGRMFAIDNGFALGFQIPQERAKRGDYKWNRNLMRLGKPLNINQRLLNAIDKKAIRDISEDLQSSQFMYDPQNWYDGDEDINEQVSAIVQFRLKHLPRLIWEQLK